MMIALSLTRQRPSEHLRDMSRRKEAPEKLSQVYFTLKASMYGNLDDETQEMVNKIISGLQIREVHCPLK